MVKSPRTPRSPRPTECLVVKQASMWVCARHHTDHSSCLTHVNVASMDRSHKSTYTAPPPGSPTTRPRTPSPLHCVQLRPHSTSRHARLLLQTMRSRRHVVCLCPDGQGQRAAHCPSGWHLPTRPPSKPAGIHSSPVMWCCCCCCCAASQH